jgi:hypothetical protein
MNLRAHLGLIQEERVLDTRGGSVQDLQLHDVTRFGATTSLDLIVGDGDGHITIFSHHEILQRSSAAYAITTLAVTTDIRNDPFPVASWLDHSLAHPARALGE